MQVTNSSQHKVRNAFTSSAKPGSAATHTMRFDRMPLNRELESYPNQGQPMKKFTASSLWRKGHNKGPCTNIYRQNSMLSTGQRR